MNLGDRSYPIIIQKGLLDKIGGSLKEKYIGEKIAVITDRNVGRLYARRLEDTLVENGFKVKIITVEPGEKSKSIAVLTDIWNELLDFEITRGDMIMTLGGGVAGDLGGFAASTLLRGIPFVQVPTSLLAQIDSSIGGKTAINLPKGKNLVGSFYQPEIVFIDPDLLTTLESRFFRDGMAEVIKYGCIRNKELFDYLVGCENEEETFENIERVIHDCCKIKKEIVERDEMDLGERMLLNFGHTMGHALEKYFGFNKYTHGEAVAVGMYHITRKTEELGITEKRTSERIKNLLEKYSLPFEMPEADKDELLKTIGFDKKNKGKNIDIIMLKKIGDSFIKKIPKEEVHKYF